MWVLQRAKLEEGTTTNYLEMLRTLPSCGQAQYAFKGQSLKKDKRTSR